MKPHVARVEQVTPQDMKKSLSSRVRWNRGQRHFYKCRGSKPMKYKSNNPTHCTKHLDLLWHAKVPQKPQH